jgi:hypothetical protein
MVDAPGLACARIVPESVIHQSTSCSAYNLVKRQVMEATDLVAGRLWQAVADQSED